MSGKTRAQLQDEIDRLFSLLNKKDREVEIAEQIADRQSDAHIEAREKLHISSRHLTIIETILKIKDPPPF